MSEPYETLGLPLKCTQQEVRKAYKRLALQFHPDKNREGLVAELAHVAFTVVVAAFEVLGTPDKRAAFDEASLGSGGRFEGNFNARWENHEFEWDSDMYKGAQYGAPPGGGPTLRRGRTWRIRARERGLSRHSTQGTRAAMWCHTRCLVRPSRPLPVSDLPPSLSLSLSLSLSALSLSLILSLTLSPLSLSLLPARCRSHMLETPS